MIKLVMFFSHPGNTNLKNQPYCWFYSRCFQFFFNHVSLEKKVGGLFNQIILESMFVVILFDQ